MYCYRRYSGVSLLAFFADRFQQKVVCSMLSILGVILTLFVVHHVSDINTNLTAFCSSNCYCSKSNENRQLDGVDK